MIGLWQSILQILNITIEEDEQEEEEDEDDEGGEDKDPPVDEDPKPMQSAKIVSLDAHVMDKESLVHKSIEQDVLEEYQNKYEKRMWIQRLPMYFYARFRQNRRIDKRLNTNRENNQAIEFSPSFPHDASKRQQRIASSIANFAGEHDL